MSDLTALLGSSPQLDWSQMTLRGLIVFFYGLVALRLLGRRVSGKWAALDIIVAVTVGSTLSRAMTGNARLGPALVAVTVILVLHRLLALAAAVSPLAARVLEGRKVALAEDGRLREQVMKKSSVSPSDIEEALRTHGLDNLDDAKSINLEPSGKISVVRR